MCRLEHFSFVDFHLFRYLGRRLLELNHELNKKWPLRTSVKYITNWKLWKRSGNCIFNEMLHLWTRSINTWHRLQSLFYWKTFGKLLSYQQNLAFYNISLRFYYLFPTAVMCKQRTFNNNVWMQKQDDITGAAEAKHNEWGTERGSGGALPGAVQAWDGATAAGEDEPCRGVAPDTRRYQRGTNLH